MLLIEYPKCSTCQKARKFLEASGAAFTSRHIVENPPTKEELRAWIAQSGLPSRRFFNTSGLKYRELGLKDRLSGLSLEEQLDLLAGDGMLVKRPILISGDTILVGFRESQWSELLNG